jgi:hypothetical protein
MVPGLINVDFADVRTIMTGMGRALMGTGSGRGDKRALEAAQQAISSPLLEDVSINGATGILINITGGPDLTLSEVTEAATLIEEAADPGANIIFGSVIDAHAGDNVRITVIATGFQPSQQEMAAAASSGNGGGHGGHGGRGTGGRRTATDQMALPMGGYQPHAYGSPHVQAQLHAPSLAQPQVYAPAGASRSTWPAAAIPTTMPGPMGPSGTAPWPPAIDHASAHQPDYYEEARAMGQDAGADGMDIVEDLDGEFAESLAAPMRGQPMPGATMPGSEWHAGGAGERPIIRPPVSANPGLRGRATGPMSRVAQTDQFGDEESELDRPTFIRRGILPPG